MPAQLEIDRRTLLQTGLAAAATLGASGSVAADGTAPTPNWTHFRGGPRRRGRSPITPPEPERVRWSIGLGHFEASPSVVGDAVYVGDKSGQLLRLNRKTGAVEWRADLSGPARYAPAVSDGGVYVGTKDGTVHAFAADSGEERWSQPLGGSALPPVVSDGELFVSTIHRENDTFYRLYRFDAATGEFGWKLRRSSRFNVDDALPLIWPIPALTENAVVANFSWSKEEEKVDPVTAFDRETKEVVWRTEINDTVGHSAAPAVGDRSVYVASDDVGLARLSRSTGGVTWTAGLKQDSGMSTIAAIGEDRVGFVDFHYHKDPAYEAFAAADGEEQWSTGSDGKGGLMTTAGGQFYFVADGTLRAVDGASGLVDWEFQLDQVGDVRASLVGTEPIPTPHGVLVQYGGTLYMLGDGTLSTPTDATTAGERSGGGDSDADAGAGSGDGGSGGGTSGGSGEQAADGGGRSLLGGGPLSSLSVTAISTILTAFSILIGLLQLRRGDD